MPTGTPFSRLAGPLSQPFLLARALRALGGVWGRHLEPVLGVVSALGWAVLGAALLLWAAGQAYGWQEAKTAAIAALVLFLIAVGFILGRSSYGVLLDLAPVTVQGDEPPAGHPPARDRP